MLKRRTFLQVMAAAGTWLASPFKAKAIHAVPNPLKEALIKPHVSCCYIYNPGLDIEGVQSLTFWKTKVIKGGQITRIEQGEERNLHGFTELEENQSLQEDWIRQGLYRKEKIKLADEQSYFVFNKKVVHSAIYETHHVLIHPALEIACNLIQEESRYGSMVLIKEWNNKAVDLNSINALLTGDTLSARLAAVSRLPLASWRMTSVLRKYIPVSIKETIKTLSGRLTRHLEGLRHGEHRFTNATHVNMAALLDINPDFQGAAKEGEERFLYSESDKSREAEIINAWYDSILSFYRR